MKFALLNLSCAVRRPRHARKFLIGALREILRALGRAESTLPVGI